MSESFEFDETAQTKGKQKMNAPVTVQQNALREIAGRYGMSPENYQEVVLRTIMPEGTTRAQFQAFIVVANTYKLNPLLQEIYAFRTRGGGIQPIVGVNGWVALINRQPEFDGLEFDYEWQEQDPTKLVSVTCRIYRKDRSRPTEVTEYMHECKMGTDAWNTRPVRMLRHKALIQCARYAFSVGGIMDEEEGEQVKDITPLAKPKESPPKMKTLEDFGNGHGKEEKPKRGRKPQSSMREQLKGSLAVEEAEAEEAAEEESGGYTSDEGEIVD